MGYIKVKYPKPKNEMWICPKCESHRVQQKNEEGPFKFLCIACYWHGVKPIIQNRRKSKSVGNIVRSVEYAEMIRGLIAGKSLSEQFEIYGCNAKTIDGRLGAIKNKILRIYNAFSEYSGIPCTDPNFVKIRVTPDVSALLILAIQEEEKRLQNSPRLSITCSK